MPQPLRDKALFERLIDRLEVEPYDAKLKAAVAWALKRGVAPESAWLAFCELSRRMTAQEAA